MKIFPELQFYDIINTQTSNKAAALVNSSYQGAAENHSSPYCSVQVYMLNNSGIHKQGENDERY